jgi:diphthamide biosynthesis protein 2
MNRLDGHDLAPVMQRHLDCHPLVFILGDSTYGSCCPDEVAAQHLNADVLIHYGYACLNSSSERIPVVYAFGITDADTCSDVVDVGNQSSWEDCVNLVTAQVNKSIDNQGCNDKLLVLYDVRYYHAIKGLQEKLKTVDGINSVIMGSIPEQQLRKSNMFKNANSGCCNATMNCSDATCCGINADTTSCSNESCCQSSGQNNDNTLMAEHCETEDAIIDVSNKEYPISRTIGGLEIPDNLNLSHYTLLYIGGDLNVDASNDSTNHNTRFLHILLRSSAADGCKSIWSYSPAQHILNCDLLNSPVSSSDTITFSTFLSKTLRRRYFLIQKAKMATTIGILIGTTTTSISFRLTLARIRHRIQSTGRTAYTFAVGKLATSSTKVTNFAEIDCFVLIACQESIAKFWRMEREDMVVPVITPFELDIALGLRQWDGRYSCDMGDLVRWDKEDGVDEHIVNSNDTDANDDDDQPFFSMISGKYESSRAPKHNATTNLQELPGQGQITEYRSEAAEFLKKREYQGLEANVGLTEAKAAVIGKAGIASDYGEV